MSRFARRYEQIQWELLKERGLGVMSEEEEDRILERMDVCWWKMSEDERAEAEQRIAEASMITSTDDFDLYDVEVAIESVQAPRKAA